ncbi:SNARE associated Golgi protein [Pseudodesulfovibrio sp. F-1]|uniref:TVP38/TMEM64 family membrane protein n=1 Tax=Pseudodesulfovibrio alkaliphilus TaxID=2661613 RepID=A0A7K1KLD7_9BACT|nr:VTT domain-containing protein [Pseudodesulfovibrio alkaliphilus]MUM76888.1 SNARE associated Golgi protein [Pseudodesulfovibrio alkaliphilus]
MSDTPRCEKRRSLGAVVKGLVMLAGLALAVYLGRSLGLDDMLRNTRWFNDHVLGTGPMSVVIFLAVGGVFTAVGLPRQVIAFLGGFAFGAVGGTLLSTLGAGLGCALAAGYARWGGREFVTSRLGERIRRVDGFLRHRPFRTALAIRFFPFGSNGLTNLAAGVSAIPLGPFILGSTLGYIPQSFIFALFGAGMNKDSATGMALSIGMGVVLFVGSIWMGTAVYRSYRDELAANGDH